MIISDQNLHFTSKLLKSLFDLPGMDLRFSVAFYPQTDDQSERMIQTMESFLRPYVKRRLTGWSEHPVLMHFAVDNAVNVATGYTPFFLCSGDHPIILSILLHGKDVSSHVEVVQIMVDWMKIALEEVQVNLSIVANWA